MLIPREESVAGNVIQVLRVKRLEEVGCAGIFLTTPQIRLISVALEVRDVSRSGGFCLALRERSRPLMFRGSHIVR